MAWHGWAPSLQVRGFIGLLSKSDHLFLSFFLSFLSFSSLKPFILGQIIFFQRCFLSTGVIWNVLIFLKLEKFWDDFLETFPVWHINPQKLFVLWNYFCSLLQIQYSLCADVKECSNHSGFRAGVATWLQVSAPQQLRELVWICTHRKHCPNSLFYLPFSLDSPSMLHRVLLWLLGS